MRNRHNPWFDTKTLEEKCEEQLKSWELYASRSYVYPVSKLRVHTDMLLNLDFMECAYPSLNAAALREFVHVLILESRRLRATISSCPHPH